jgi:hypothetical protein
MRAAQTVERSEMDDDERREHPFASGWNREHIQVQVEVATDHALLLDDDEGAAVQVSGTPTL